MITKLKSFIVSIIRLSRKGIQKGLVVVVGAKFLNRIMLFGSSVVLVRFLNKNDFGIWSYAMNILNFFLLARGLGIEYGITYYGSRTEDIEKKQKYLLFGLKFGLLFDIGLALILLIFTHIVSLPVAGTNQVLKYLIFLPLLVTIFELFSGFFRAQLKNNHYSVLTVGNTLLCLVGYIIGARFFFISGVIAARNVAFVFTVVLGIFLVRSLWKPIQEYVLEKKEKIKILKYSLVSALNGYASQILYLIDIFLIGIIIADSTIVADYRTATLIPFGLSFIPTSLMTFGYPYFVRWSKDLQKFKRNYLYLIRALFILNILICVFLFIFTRFVIRLFFGTAYLDVVVPFRILTIGYLISGTLRVPNGNLIASLGKVRVNLYVSTISGALNIGLDIILIYLLGSVGAAIATVSIFAISTIITTVYLHKILQIRLHDYFHAGDSNIVDSVIRGRATKS
jgi:O-antigen/teichoic acid export membrane protein